MAQTWTSAQLATAEPVIRKITIQDVRDALARGIDDFNEIPTQLVFLSILYPVIGLIAARAAYGGAMMPLFFPLVAGLTLMGPVLATGIYELSRRREKGLYVSWINAFDAFRSPAILSIVTLGIVLLGIFVAWIAAARGIYEATLGDTAPRSVGVFLWLVFNTAEGWTLIVVGNLVGFLFAVLVLSLSVVSFPLMLDRNVGVETAIRTSLRAVAANPVPMAVWGLIVAVALFLGCLPLFVGLAVVMPVLGHATWHLYRKTVI